MTELHRPKILCVDDEPDLLEGISLTLGRRFNVIECNGGVAGLQMLTRDKSIQVIISDMRMPQMTGVEFLAAARDMAPQATRMLLTGQADLPSIIEAINKGHIYRFISKPCSPTHLVNAVEDALVQHNLVTAEHVLLEQTLQGSVKALMDVLALTNPVSFGRAQRVRRHASTILDGLMLRERWQIEMAASVSQLGYVALPPEVADKIYSDEHLEAHEQAMLDKVPEITRKLLEPIPRLEGVLSILDGSHPRGFDSMPSLTSGDLYLRRGAQIVRMAIEQERLESKGCSQHLAITTLRNQGLGIDADILEALKPDSSTEETQWEPREVGLAALRSGMLLAEDIKASNGTLLAARGYEITSSFIERARNFPRGTLKEPLHVLVRHEA
mgnify:CR=1 FL=1